MRDTIAHPRPFSRATARAGEVLAVIAECCDGIVALLGDVSESGVRHSVVGVGVNCRT